MERQPKILDVGFNAAILHIAAKLTGGFSVSDSAPQTFEDLISQVETHRQIVVWSGASDATIYGSPEVNFAFRAWHDWCHWRGRHRFTTLGEAAVAEMQCQHIIALYGACEQTQRWCRIIRAEVNGQQCYHDMHGHFPVDQFAFVERYLRENFQQQMIATE